MNIVYSLVGAVLVAVTFLPLVSEQHWFFRIWDFGRIQLLIIQILFSSLGLMLVEIDNWLFWAVQACLFLSMGYNFYILIPYTRLYGYFRAKKKPARPKIHEKVSLLSINVYQFNNEYHRLLKLIEETDPDIVFTMETNQDWEDALSVLEEKYPNYEKVALENTYGMHFYTRLNILKSTVHYFVADDLPSMEIDLETPGSHTLFTFFGVHPPPPSPTEEDTAEESDGELLSVAKLAEKHKNPVVAVGDFNTVAWARTSKLFRKVSGLIDPRIGLGFVSTFHAKYRLLRFPIDQLFHSNDIIVNEFKTLRHINSDHLPLYCEFGISEQAPLVNDTPEKADTEEKDEAEHLIQKGKEKVSDRPAVAKE